jgi:phage FluMu protein Com
MKVKCPHCGCIALAPDQSAGNEIECPQCKNLHVAKAYEVDVMADGAAAKKKESPPKSLGLLLLMLFGVLLIVLSVLSVLFAASEVVVVVAFGGIAVGVVLIALGYLQRHIEKTTYWANRIHEELRRQNKV